MPLIPKHKKVIADDVDWSDLVWGNDSLKVRNQQEYKVSIEPLINFKMYDIVAK